MVFLALRRAVTLVWLIGFLTIRSWLPAPIIDLAYA